MFNHTLPRLLLWSWVCLVKTQRETNDTSKHFVLIMQRHHANSFKYSADPPCEISFKTYEHSHVWLHENRSRRVFVLGTCDLIERPRSCSGISCAMIFYLITGFLYVHVQSLKIVCCW